MRLHFGVLKYFIDNDIEAQIRGSSGIQHVSIGKSWRDLIPVIKVDISSVSCDFLLKIDPNPCI